MIKNLKKRTEGFTIIEVMIVLVIAAIILLIVFLAVPALQRNSRNTQRKNEISRVGTAVNNWVSNNNGQVFTAGTGNANLNAVITELGALGQYTLTAGTTFTVATGAQGAMNTIANVRVVTGAICGTNGATNGSSNTRQMTIQYALETPGGAATGTAICQEI
jgi:prepilin-type N-terminal cleavage/methylation domain-containing protein